jgi:cytosine/uracil/thiamine/allantoin permease
MPDLSSLGLVAFAFLVILPVVSLVLLAVCWLFGDLGLAVKVTFTVVFLASFGLLFTKVPQLFIAAHALLCLVIGFAVFFTYWVPPAKGRGRGIVR